jgi:ankyrin repeat protein
MRFWMDIFGVKKSAPNDISERKSPLPSSSANSGRPSIHEAVTASFGGLGDVKGLLDYNPDLVFSKDDVGRTPLHLAAYHGDTGAAELLLANKAEVNVTDNNGSTPLHMTAKLKWHGNKGVAELLLANKAEVNVTDNNGHTPLHWAAANGHKDVVELLLSNKADVNAKDKDDHTPLHYATTRGHQHVAELLRQHSGAEIAPPAPPAFSVPSSAPLAPKLVRYRGLTFGIDGEYSLVWDYKKIVRGIWYRYRDDIKNATRNRMIVAKAGVDGFTVLDSDYATTVVEGIGGIEDLQNPGGAILWFDSTRELFGK